MNFDHVIRNVCLANQIRFIRTPWGRLRVLPTWMYWILFLAFSAIAEAGLASEPQLKLTIHTDHPSARINPEMWGIFFEDINFGADGGLYAELVKNRGFEFPQNMLGWSEVAPAPGAGKLEIRSDEP